VRACISVCKLVGRSVAALPTCFPNAFLTHPVRYRGSRFENVAEMFRAVVAIFRYILAHAVNVPTRNMVGSSGLTGSGHKTVQSMWVGLTGVHCSATPKNAI